MKRKHMFKSLRIGFLAASVVLGIPAAMAVMGDEQNIGLAKPDANSSFSLVVDTGTTTPREVKLTAKEDPATGALTLTSPQGDAFVLMSDGAIRIDPDVVGQNWQLNRDGVPIVVAVGGVLSTPAPVTGPTWPESLTFTVKVFGGQVDTAGQSSAILITPTGEVPSATLDHVTGPGAEFFVNFPFHTGPFEYATAGVTVFDGDNSATQTTPPGASTAVVFGANAGNGFDFTGLLLGNLPINSNLDVEVDYWDINFKVYSSKTWDVGNNGQAKWGLLFGYNQTDTDFTAFEAIPNNLVTLNTAAEIEQNALRIGPLGRMQFSGTRIESYVEGRVYAQYADTDFVFNQNFNCPGCRPPFTTANINLKQSDSDLSFGLGLEAGIGLPVFKRANFTFYGFLDLREFSAVNTPFSGDQVLAGQTATFDNSHELSWGVGAALEIFTDPGRVKPKPRIKF